MIEFFKSGYLSPYYLSSFEVDGVNYKSFMHWYQSQRFKGTSL